MTKEFNQQDEDYLKIISKTDANEIKKGKNIFNQTTLYDFLLGMRVQYQRILSTLQTLPQEHLLIDRIIHDKNLLYEANNKALQLLSNLFEINSFFIKNLTISNISYPTFPQQNRFFSKNDVDSIYTRSNEFLDSSLSLNEETVNSWYNKSQVQQNGKQSRLGNINNFCEHIKEGVLNNFQNFLKKTQSKDLNQRIIGKSKNRFTETDKEIFNDNDFYLFLLKNFNFEETKTNENENFELTKKFLIHKQSKIKENKMNSKGSKNRSLLFDKHEKLINFMTPNENLSLNQSRDDLILTFFGKSMKSDSQNLQRKHASKSSHDDIEDDFDLI